MTREPGCAIIHTFVRMDGNVNFSYSESPEKPMEFL